MVRYIDADVFVRLIKEKYRFNDFLSANSAQKIIDNIPTADVAPVIHGHWMDTFQAENGYYMGVCSHCYLPNIVSLYCGKCGAKMDEEV